MQVMVIHEHSSYYLSIRPFCDSQREHLIVPEAVRNHESQAGREEGKSNYSHKDRRLVGCGLLWNTFLNAISERRMFRLCNGHSPAPGRIGSTIN